MVDYDTRYGQYYGCDNHSQSCWLLGLPYCPHKSSWERHDQLERLVVDLHSSHEMFIVLCGNYHNEPPTFSKNPFAAAWHPSSWHQAKTKNLGSSKFGRSSVLSELDCHQSLRWSADNVYADLLYCTFACICYYPYLIKYPVSRRYATRSFVTLSELQTWLISLFTFQVISSPY